MSPFSLLCKNSQQTLGWREPQNCGLRWPINYNLLHIQGESIYLLWILIKKNIKMSSIFKNLFVIIIYISKINHRFVNIRRKKIYHSPINCNLFHIQGEIILILAWNFYPEALLALMAPYIATCSIFKKNMLFSVTHSCVSELTCSIFIIKDG